MRALAIIAALLSAALCFESGWANVLKCDNTLRVSVLANGDLLIDGVKSDLAALDERLAALEKSRGSVWYYREASGADPTPQNSATMQKAFGLIMKHSTPISLSSKPDFSDSIDGQGNSTPRTHC